MRQYGVATKIATDPSKVRMKLPLALVWMLTVSTLAAAATGPDGVPAAVQSAVHLTGALTDAAWDSAAATSDFIQREPKEGAAPSQRTEFKVVYDATMIYVKVRAFDTEPDKIVTYLTRRDFRFSRDFREVFNVRPAASCWSSSPTG